MSTNPGGRFLLHGVEALDVLSGAYIGIDIYLVPRVMKREHASCGPSSNTNQGSESSYKDCRGNEEEEDDQAVDPESVDEVETVAVQGSSL